MTASKNVYPYALWIEQLIARGLEPWFVTFMFHQLPGSAASRQQHMLAIVNRIYEIRITRVIKHPRAAINRDRRPVWLAAPDLPIFKHLKQTLQVLLVNDGQHVHAIVLEPTDRRFIECFAKFAWAEQQRWRQLFPELERIDVRAITHNVPRVVGYALKQIEEKVGSDAVLIRPRTNDELRKRGGWVGRNSSIFAETPALDTSRDRLHRC